MNFNFIKNNMRILKYISIIILLTVLALYLRSTFAEYQEFGGSIFNTYYRIKIRTPLPDKTLPGKVRKTLEEIDAQMSVFRPDSEISRFNRTPADTEFPLSDGLSSVLRQTVKINRQSGGAFDPAVAPLIDLWGFGPQHRFQEPSRQEIAEVLSYSRLNKLRFSPNFASVTKKDARTSLNLSAIAKGYAVDRVFRVLEEAGFKDYIIDIGGEIRLSGTRDDAGNLWNVGVGVPLKDSMANAMVVEISDYAIATSGDYRNFIERDGKSFSHTISPQNGLPVKNELASATVFAPDCMEADAYATAIMALGAEEGIRLAEKLKLPVILFLHRGNGKFAMRVSSAARELIGLQNETD